MASERKLQAAICEYLANKKASVIDAADSLDVAIQCIAEAFVITSEERRAVAAEGVDLSKLFAAHVSAGTTASAPVATPPATGLEGTLPRGLALAQTMHGLGAQWLRRIELTLPRWRQGARNIPHSSNHPIMLFNFQAHPCSRSSWTR